MQVTELIHRAADGDDEAGEQLFKAVYEDLRRQAQRYMRGQPRHHSMWVTDVVHGAYARLCGEKMSRWTDRKHFFSAAALAMEHLLVDHARRKATKKRKPPGDRKPLDDLQDAYERSIPDVVANVIDVHEALVELEAIAPRAAEVVRLRFFAHLSMDRIATTMGVPKRTIEHDWTYAKAWMVDWFGRHGRGR